MKSTLLVLEPEAKAKPKPQSEPKTAPPPKPAAEARPKPDPQADRRRRRWQPRNRPKRRCKLTRRPGRERWPKHTPELRRKPKRRPRTSTERRTEDAVRRQKLEALADASFLDALEDEALDLQAQSEAADSEAVAQSFQLGIYQAVVGNWSRPPSARNGMQAKLRVELVPTGDVVAVSLVESSGNGAFDRSAEAAVRKARRFEVPKDPELFEQYFRRFTLLFRPEDLLR